VTRRCPLGHNSRRCGKRRAIAARLAWLIERGRGAEAADMSETLLFFWLIRGHTIEGLRWYERVLAMRDLTPAAESRALLGAAWGRSGRLLGARQCRRDPLDGSMRDVEAALGAAAAAG